MSKVTLYRVDQRDFQPNDAIPHPGDHLARMKPEHQPGEELLRAVSPEKGRMRAESLYTFEQLRTARVYYLGTKDSRLYEIQVDEADILHKADMTLVNDIAANQKDLKTQDQLIADYWKGAYRDGKWIEVLVKKATVIRRIHGPSQIEKIEVKNSIISSKRL